MIIEIYLLLTVIGISLAVLGVLSRENFHSGVLCVIAITFLVGSAYYSLSLETEDCYEYINETTVSGNVTTYTNYHECSLELHTYPPLAYLFGGLVLALGVLAFGFFAASAAEPMRI